MLIKTGDASRAFAIREIPTPNSVADNEVLIKVSTSGLNFADVMARRGMYKDFPPLPAIPGYDVTGIVERTGDGVSHVQPGDRVTAMTRFGGYAEYVITRASGVAKIPDGISDADATALTTQYCTAYYAAAEAVNLFPGDKVLVHAGAGGVGTALIQYARNKGCEIFSTAGSVDKLKQLSASGVQHPINYRTQDFEKEIRKMTHNKGVDVIFDAVGGISVKKGFRLLAAGGRIVCYGAAVLSNNNIIGKIKEGIGFGFYHPAMLMMPSKSIIGINMLRIADDKPEVLQRCLSAVIHLTEKGIFAPPPATIFAVEDIAAAHDFLESRKSTGKVVLQW